MRGPDENPCGGTMIHLRDPTMKRCALCASPGGGGGGGGSGGAGAVVADSGYSAGARLWRRAAAGGGRRAQACSSDAGCSWRRRWLKALNCGNQPL